MLVSASVKITVINTGSKGKHQETAECHPGRVLRDAQPQELTER